MNVLFETTWLAPGGVQAAAEVRLNGRQIVDDAMFFRAAYQTYFPRGNLYEEFSFTTHWILQTTTLSENFVMTHIGNLPMTNADTGPLQVICGAESSPQTIYSSLAVLESAEIIKYEGLSVDVRYSLRCQPFTSSVPPNIPAYPNANELVPVFRRGQINISVGATSVAVTFSSPLNTLPGADPYCWISGPTGSTMFDCWCMHDTITVNGFTAGLGDAAPSGSYWLNYAVFQ